MSKINVISFATDDYRRSQQFLENYSYQNGANKVYSYSINDIDSTFIKKNYSILSKKRGAGYWLWKPYLIKKTFDLLNNGDYLFYIDSGAYPISSLDVLAMNQDITCFELHGLYNKYWTKYDCFHLMNCTESRYFDSYQMNAAFQVYRKNTNSCNFIQEYLELCQDEKILTDCENLFGQNINGFKEHRHDQSVFTNLCIKYNIKPHRDPSQYGNPFVGEYSDTYAQVFNHHRTK